MARPQLTQELLAQHLEALECHLNYFSRHGSAESTALGSLATTFSPSRSQPIIAPANRPLRVPIKSFHTALKRLGCEIFFLCALASPRDWIQLVESNEEYVLSLRRWWYKHQVAGFSQYAMNLYYTYGHLISLREPTAPQLYGSTPIDGGFARSLMTTYATATFSSHERPRVETKRERGETSPTSAIRGWERSIAHDNQYVSFAKADGEFRNSMLVHEVGVDARSPSVKYEISSDGGIDTPTNADRLYDNTAGNIHSSMPSHGEHEGSLEPTIWNMPGGADGSLQDSRITAPPWYGAAEMGLQGWGNGYGGQGMGQSCASTLSSTCNWENSMAYVNQFGSYLPSTGLESMATGYNGPPNFVGQTPVGQSGGEAMSNTDPSMAWDDRFWLQAMEAEYYPKGRNYP